MTHIHVNSPDKCHNMTESRIYERKSGCIVTLPTCRMQVPFFQRCRDPAVASNYGLANDDEPTVSTSVSRSMMTTPSVRQCESVNDDEPQCMLVWNIQR